MPRLLCRGSGRIWPDRCRSGSGLIKQRVARQAGGKSGGYSLILILRSGDHPVTQGAAMINCEAAKFDAKLPDLAGLAPSTEDKPSRLHPREGAIFVFDFAKSDKANLNAAELNLGGWKPHAIYIQRYGWPPRACCVATRSMPAFVGLADLTA